MNKVVKKANQTFRKQHDQSDCGIACLSSLIRFYGGNINLETLRELSGTTRDGTTLLGLVQSATKIGFEANGFNANMDALQSLTEPCILHVIKGDLNHYITFYGIYPDGKKTNTQNEKKYIIGDPAEGIAYITESELNILWAGKNLLIVKPTDKFVITQAERREKIKWFFDILKTDLPLLAINVSLGLIITILGLSMAIFSQKLIDKILPSARVDKLILDFVLVFCLLTCKSFFSFVRQHFLLLQGRDFNIRITSRFYENLMFLPKTFFDHRKTGDLVARVNDTMRIQDSISFITGNFFIDALLLIVSIGYLFTCSVFIGCIALLTLPVMLYIAIHFNNPIVKGQRNTMVAYAKNESNYVDTIQGMNAIKESVKENTFLEITKSVYGLYQEQIFKLGKTGNTFGLVTDLMATFLILSIFGSASYLVLTKSLTFGQMVAITSIASGIVPASVRLALTNLRIQEARVAFDRMYEFASIAPEFSKPEEVVLIDKNIKDPIKNNFKELTISNIAFRFPGRKLIFKNASFNIKKGEFIALTGESGCGKSTLLQIIQKNYETENGEIKVNGLNIKDIYTPSWRKIISTVPQDIKIFNGTILFNITLTNHPDILNEFNAFCISYGFSNIINSFPQGPLTLIGEEGINLSGGQKQLVAIARALFKKPELLLLDEATSAMDSKMETAILHLFFQLKENISIIFVTHKDKLAQIMDRTYVVEQGQVLMQETISL